MKGYSQNTYVTTSCWLLFLSSACDSDSQMLLSWHECLQLYDGSLTTTIRSCYRLHFNKLFNTWIGCTWIDQMFDFQVHGGSLTSVIRTNYWFLVDKVLQQVHQLLMTKCFSFNTAWQVTRKHYQSNSSPTSFSQIQINQLLCCHDMFSFKAVSRSLKNIIRTVTWSIQSSKGTYLDIPLTYRTDKP